MIRPFNICLFIEAFSSSLIRDITRSEAYLYSVAYLKEFVKKEGLRRMNLPHSQTWTFNTGWLMSWLNMASIMQGLLLGLVLAWLDPKSVCWNLIWIHKSTTLCYYVNKVIIHFCELLIFYMKHLVLLLYDFCNVMERININLQLELDQENWTYIFNICRGRAEKDRIKRQQVIERCFQF